MSKLQNLEYVLQNVQKHKNGVFRLRFFQHYIRVSLSQFMGQALRLEQAMWSSATAKTGQGGCEHCGQNRLGPSAAATFPTLHVYELNVQIFLAVDLLYQRPFLFDVLIITSFFSFFLSFFHFWFSSLNFFLLFFFCIR